MAVSYTQTLSTDMIVSEVENLVDWQTEFVRYGCYPAARTAPPEAKPPGALLAWCKKEAERKALDPKICERFNLVYEDLVRVAAATLENCAEGKALSLEDFDAFQNQFEGYVTQIRRLQQDASESILAIDSVTGLRTVAGMRNDIKREQDRFDRKGTSFSVAAILVDGLDHFEKKYDRRNMEAIYVAVAQVIARTVRSFDDAYFLGKGEYIVVLKHVEFMDACTVMDRLRGAIEATTVLMLNGDKPPITASLGIAEALQRGNADLVLEHAKSALRDAREAGGNRVKEFHERSKLEQYARTLTKP